MLLMQSHMVTVDNVHNDSIIICCYLLYFTMELMKSSRIKCRRALYFYVNFRFQFSLFGAVDVLRDFKLKLPFNRITNCYF